MSNAGGFMLALSWLTMRLGVPQICEKASWIRDAWRLSHCSCACGGGFYSSKALALQHIEGKIWAAT